ncbi:hypothetical protein ACET3Z_010118 [Daucus carota]
MIINLAARLKVATLQEDKSAFDIDRLQTYTGRLKATYAGRLCSEYNRLVEGLAQRGNLPNNDTWLENPILPDDILMEAVPGNIRRAKHFLSVLRRLVQLRSHALASPSRLIVNTHAGCLSGLETITHRLHTLSLRKLKFTCLILLKCNLHQVFKCFFFGFPPRQEVSTNHYLAQGFADNDISRVEQMKLATIRRTMNYATD